jgi:flagellar biosynthesis protein FlhF
MKVKRFYAANIREAMRKVREELGAEAVILSNRRVSDGLEIIAAIDYDEKLLKNPPVDADPASEPPAPQPAPASPLPSKTTPASLTAAPTMTKPTAMPTQTPKLASSPVASQPIRPAAEKAQVVWSQDPMLVDMQNDIKRMQHMLEQQLSGLAWGDLGRRQPQRADLLEKLMHFGLTAKLSVQLADAAADQPGQGWSMALNALSQGLMVGQDEILSEGGVVALVGPTGVGKTTTIAKLAAHYTLRHGPRQVALITTDSYRIGAFEQLRTFAMILDLPVRLVSSREELQDAIAGYSDKSLVLIDTAGMSQRDMRLSQQFALFDVAPAIKTYLVLSANAQVAMLEEAVIAFGKAPLAGSILTKVDEATRLGGVFSVLYDHKLPLAYVSNGQRVPEDLQVAQIDELLNLAERFVELYSSTADNEALALTFGRRMVNAS